MKLLLTVLIIATFWTGPLSAASVTRLYETVVKVDDQSRKSRLDAMQRALRQVLIKVSGSVMVPNRPEMDGHITKASRFVQQYRYQKGELITIDGQEQPTLDLWVRFDQKEIEKILKQNNFPVWGSARPLVLVWLVVEQNGQRLIVGEKDRGLARTILERESAQRGIPIKLPLLDEIDQQQLTAVDIWAQFEEKITATASRYAAQAVLTGRLFPLQGGSWQVHWDLYRKGEHHHWQSQGSIVELLLSGGVDGAADRMAEQFALNYGADGSESGRVELIIRGIESFPQFDKTFSYLSALDGVKRITLTSMVGTNSHFSIEVEGGVEAIKQRIALGKRLKYLESAAEGDEVERLNTLNYQLR
ncbi:MAG: DUF2066 domain-containing protein [Gammaproteobacteria bacterium]|nr:DUF2066 domain-containing protein [Gammaproteobacteria bacterium]